MPTVREKMYKFFMSLKQPDGSFIVSKDAEVDIRGVYCLLVTATLLDLLTPELVAGTASFVASIQTYEGGFASSSASYYISDDEILDEPRPTLGEAHGGYAGCAIAAWVMLLPFVEQNEKKGEILTKKVDVNKFMRWLAWMQGEVADVGGFRGRPNKLVDSCYSWWCGSSMAIVESLVTGAEGDDADPDEVEAAQEEEQEPQDEWVDAEWWLYNNSERFHD
jgi:protein farnesyltransferase subunit beta